MTLIDKLETAEAGSRELSDEVLLALGWGKIENPNAPYPWVIKTPWGSRSSSRKDAPSPTESLDDALGLVPEGRAMRFAFLPSAHWQWRVWIYRDAHMPLHEESGKPTLGKDHALALSAAILRSLDAS